MNTTKRERGRPPKPKRDRPGRPPADPSGAQIPQSVRLTPDEIKWLRDKYGSVNAGVRQLVTAAIISLSSK